jgi:hypothetical protein
MRYVVLDGKRYVMKDIHKAYKAQKDARRQTQLTLFELKEDARARAHRTAAGRYQEPSLLDLIGERRRS